MKTEKDFPESMVKLGRALKRIEPDIDFIMGVIDRLQSDEDREIVLDFLENGGDEVSIESILVLSEKIYRSHHPGYWKKPT